MGHRAINRDTITTETIIRTMTNAFFTPPLLSSQPLGLLPLTLPLEKRSGLMWNHSAFCLCIAYSMTDFMRLLCKVLAFPNKRGLNNPTVKEKALPKQLLRLRAKTSWSWEKMSREFHRVMGEDGPSQTTLFRYATGKVKRPNAVTERYVQQAIHKITVELSQKENRQA